MKNTLLSLILILLNGCIGATVDDDLSVSIDIDAATTVPNVHVTDGQAVVLTATFTATRTMDVSSELKKFADNKFGASYSVFISSDTLTSDATFAGMQRFSVKFVSDTGELIIIDHMISAEEQTETSIIVVPTTPEDATKNMLSAGPVQVVVTIVAGITENVPAKFNNTLVLHVTAHGSKTL